MGTLKCSCGNKLSSFDALYFYEQNVGAWHLIVKPGLMEEARRAALFTLSPIQSTKPASAYTPNVMLCASCKRSVGKETLVGARKEGYFCFDVNALSDITIPVVTKKRSWKNVKPFMPNIESWSCDIGLPRDLAANRQPLCAPMEADLIGLDISDLTCTSPRNYQVELFVRASRANSVVVLPTGAGKTLVAVMMAKFLKRLNQGKTVIFLADRIPLVHQQAKVLKDEGGLTVKVITGENVTDLVIDNLGMDDICSSNDVVALTARCFSNIVDQNWFQISRCCLIVFDEAHHAKGNHPFSMIMEAFKRCPTDSRPRILGLTASPGGDSHLSKTAIQIRELCSTYSDCSIFTPVLYMQEMNDIISETDTKYSYVKHTVAEEKLQIDLWQHFLSLWNLLRHSFLNETADFIPSKYGKHVAFTFPNLLKELRMLAIKEDRSSAIKLVEYSMCVLCALDETDVHGVVAIKNKLSNFIFKNRSDLRSGLEVLRWLTITTDDINSGNWSSRVEALLKVVRSVIASNEFSRILVFVQTRAKARRLVSLLDEIPDIASLRPSQLVGHSGFDGMTWLEEQKPMLDRFRSGIVKLLVSTSVLEEGLDVPSCNAVIRFDGMVSMTGTVQSRGRARQRDSQFVVLVTEEESKTSQMIKLQEQNMMVAVKTYQESFSQSLQTIVFHLTEKLQVSDDNKSRQGIRDTDQDQPEWSPEDAFVIKMNFHSEWLNESRLQATLSDFSNVWKCDMEHSLVYLCAPDGQDSISTYLSICRNAIPLLLEHDQDNHLWLQKCTPDPSPNFSESHSENCDLYLKSMALGYFKSPSRYVQACSLDGLLTVDQSTDCSSPSSISLAQGEDALLLSVPGKITLEFPLAAIYDWVVLHHEEDHQRLYIPLRQAPLVYAMDGGKLHRIANAADHGSVSVRNLINMIGEFFIYELLFKTADINQHVAYTQLIDCFKKYGVLIYDSVIKREEEKESMPSSQKSPDLSYSTLYLMEFLFSQYGCFLTRNLALHKFYELLGSCPSQYMQECAILAMVGQIGWFCNPVALLNQALEELSVAEKPELCWFPNNYVLVRSATVTPSRVIFYEPIPMKCSRMLRHFQAEDFLKVSFREENMDFLCGTEEQLLERVKGVLKTGLHLANKKFMFLGSSSSMLHQHSCWMTCLEPRVVQNWLGDFNTVQPRCVGKYAASVGLGMTSSDVTIRVDNDVIENPISDIEIGQYCFSEGVGKISRRCLLQVLHCLQPKGGHIREITSALQVRVAGYKGILVLDPTLQPEHIQCVFRKSMFQFHSQHTELEVLSTASNHPAYLNRQAIVLLSSLGVQDSTFVRLQEKQLQNLLKIFTHRAEEKIVQHCQELSLASVCHAGLSIHSEPFLQLVLAAVYNEKVRVLVEKTHIFVPDGCILMGVMDETSSLDYGEIFVQLCDASTHWGTKIMEGPCVAYKDPCFHPGDVRKLYARDVPLLHHLVNCVVFPAKGHRPHPNEMSGSDLGGDLYTIIWMSDLIPDQHMEPLSYNVGSVQEVATLTESNMNDYFVKTIQNVELGRIANAHLALADCREGGALHADCIALAKVHASAMDIAGHQVQIPENLVPNTYPDFVGKYSKASYPSEKIIGKLYRRAKSLSGDEHYHHVHLCVKPDNLLLIRGHERFSNQAKETYCSYRTAIHGFMRCYGIQQEAEIVTGCVVRMHDHLSREIVQWTEVLKQQYKQLVQCFRQQFHDQSGESSEVKYQLASAWYWAAYNDDNKELRCLSFPWIVSDVLAHIKHLSEVQHTSWAAPEDTGKVGIADDLISGPSLAESVSESMFMDFYERQPTLFASLLEREDLCEKVELCIKASLRDASVKIFGSSSTLLFEPAVSDLDLYIHIGAEACGKVPNLSSRAPTNVLKQVLPCLDQDFQGICLVENAVVPILKYEGTLPFDLTANYNGLTKRRIISSYITSYPSLLLLMTVVLRWARYVGLTASHATRRLAPFGLSWLLIQFCLEQRFISGVRIDDDCASGRPSNLLMSVIEELMDLTPTPKKSFDLGVLPGEVLLSFFQKFSDVNLKMFPGAPTGSPLSVRDPIAGERSCIEMDAGFNVTFQNACLRAWHALARTRTVKSLFSLGERQVCLRLSRFQSSIFRGSEEYYAQRLRFKSGGKAKVRIFSQSNRLSMHMRRRPAGFIPLLVEIQGDPAAVMLIERHLQELNDGQFWIPRANASFFVKGASFLLFEGSLRDEDPVGFLPYFGPSHLKHASCDLHVPVLVAPVGGLDWKTHALGKLRVSVWRQRQLILQWSQSDTPSLGQTMCKGQLRALLRFGTLYITNAPSALEVSLDKVSVSDLEDYVVRGRRQAQPWRRPAVSAAQTDLGPSGLELDTDEYYDSEKCTFVTPKKVSTKSASQKKSRKQQTGASQSLFPQVKIYIEQLRHILEKKGFTKAEEDRVTYNVAVFVPGEYKIRLNERLEFVSLSKRPVRWLAGNLVFRADQRSKHTREEAPNCLRFVIEIQNDNETTSDLLTKAKENPVLQFNGEGHLSVGEAFQGEAAFVRKVRKEAWRNSRLGLTVLVLDVSEWEGWDQKNQKFKREKLGHQEVELHLHGAEQSLRGTVSDCENFIHKFWDTAIEFRKVLYGTEEGSDH